MTVAQVALAAAVAAGVTVAILSYLLQWMYWKGYQAGQQQERLDLPLRRLLRHAPKLHRPDDGGDG